MHLRVESVAFREGETVGLGTGRSESDPGIVFVFGGDVRMMAAIGNALASGEVVEAEVPEWAILARLERPEQPEG
jgi:hypothetical protein